MITSDLFVIRRPANESSDPGLSNERGVAKIHRATTEQELVEVEAEILWNPSRTGGSAKNLVAAARKRDHDELICSETADAIRSSSTAFERGEPELSNHGRHAQIHRVTAELDPPEA